MVGTSSTDSANSESLQISPSSMGVSSGIQFVVGRALEVLG